MHSPTPTSPRAPTATEQTPLLSSPQVPHSDTQTKPVKKPWIIYVLLIFVLFIIVDTGAFLVEAPRTRLSEAKLCLAYYRRHDPSKILPDGRSIDEKFCKEDAIQQRLARVFGWQDMFDAIPGVLLAVPYGGFADQWGRKWVFDASLVGVQLRSMWILFVCYVPGLALEWTWVSSVFYVIGGGPVVMAAIGIMMVADVAPPEKRTTVFLYATASVMFAGVVAPALAGKLMEKGALLPFLLAITIQQIGIIIACFFPETKHLRDLPEPKDLPEEHEQEPETPAIDHGHGLKSQIRLFKEAISLIGRDTVLALAILTFLPNRMGRQSILLLIRYASKRYHWPIKNAAYIVSIQSATNLVGLTVFVPLANLFMLRYLRLPAHHADLWLCRGSILVTTIAFLVMGAASYPALLIIGLCIFNLGTGFDAAMRSTAVHLVGGQSSPDLGKLFALIAIVEGVGGMLAGPFLASLFDWGIKIGEPWVGMPYFASAAMVGGITVVTFLISVKGRDVCEDVDRQDDGIEAEVER